MSGAEHPENPSSKPLQPASLQLDSAGSSLENACEEGLYGSESLFAQRSGILDPLTKGAPDKKPSEETESEQKPDAPSVDPKAPKQKASPPGANAPKSPKQLDRVRRRQMDYLQTRRKKKKLRVYYSRIRLIFKLCFALLWAALLWQLLQSGFWVLDKPRFELENQHLVQAPQMMPLVTSWVGKPLYQVDVGKLAADIRQRFPVVEYASVRRHLFPARLQIQISEKLPWAELYTDEKQARPYGLVAENTFIPLKDYPYRAGLYPGRAVTKLILPPSTRYKPAFIEKMHQLTWQAQQIKGLHLVSVDARNANLVTLHFKEAPVVLGKMNSTVDERLARIIPLVPKIIELQNAIAAVDLRWEEQVTFHKKPDSHMGKPRQAPLE